MTADSRTQRLTLRNKRKGTKRTNKLSSLAEGGCGAVTSSSAARRDPLLRTESDALFFVSKFHPTQRKHLPYNSMSSGAGGTRCSRGSLASSGKRSRSRALGAGDRSCGDGPGERGAPGLALPSLAGPVALGPDRFTCLRPALWQEPRDLAEPEPTPAARPPRAVPSRVTDGLQRDTWTLSPGWSVITARIHALQEERGRKERTANGAAELPSALLPLGSSTEPLAKAAPSFVPWLKGCGNRSAPSPALGRGRGAHGAARQGNRLGPHQVRQLSSPLPRPHPFSNFLPCRSTSRQPSRR